jgi:hypothetical protein
MESEVGQAGVCGGSIGCNARLAVPALAGSRQQHAGDTLIRILIRRKQEDGRWSTYRALEG